MQKKSIERALLLGIIVLSLAAAAVAQGPPAGAPAAGAPPAGAPPAGRRGPPRPAFWVSSTAWPDGGEIPLKNAGRGDNKSPAFEFHWNLGTDPGPAPDTLQTYAVILHDIQNSSNKGIGDTLHWSAFNIPGTAKGLPEGIDQVICRMARATVQGFGRARISVLALVRGRFITTSLSSMRSIRSWTCRRPRRATIC